MARENNVTGFGGKNGKKKYCNVILIVFLENQKG
jgi:hypothetical protein